VATGSPYAVTPGVLRKDDGSPYRVYSPYFRAWLARGVHAPRPSRPGRPLVRRPGCRPDGVPRDPDLGDVPAAEAGEQAALARWRPTARPG
jgi:deoxyribodipyrimidine photo-lyase